MREVDNAIIKVSSLEKQAEELKQRITKGKKKIQEYFDNNKIKTLEVEPSDTNSAKLIATKRERVTINYLPDKLQERLSKMIFGEISIRQYYIVDVEGLVSLLKKAKIPASDFKKYVGVNTTIDKKRVEQLYSVGDITKKQLEGCFEAKIVKFIEIAERKGDSD